MQLATVPEVDQVTFRIIDDMRMRAYSTSWKSDTILCAQRTLIEALVEGRVRPSPLPKVWFHEIQSENSDLLASMEQSRRERIARAVLSEIRVPPGYTGFMPTVEQLAATEPDEETRQWIPPHFEVPFNEELFQAVRRELLKRNDETRAIVLSIPEEEQRQLLRNELRQSFEEQAAWLEYAYGEVDRFILNNNSTDRGLILLGSPGSGKSFYMKCVLAYAQARGLRVEISTLCKKRAVMLGGVHWAQLLLTGSRKINAPDQSLDTMMQRFSLTHNQLKQVLLRRLHILAIDEISLTAEEDIELAGRLKERLNGVSYGKAGGMLIVATADSRQMGNIEDMHVMKCPTFPLQWRVALLRCNVRAKCALTLQMQRVLQAGMVGATTDQERRETEASLRRAIHDFVVLAQKAPSFAALPPGTPCVLSRHKGIEAAQREVVHTEAQRRADGDSQVLECDAIDVIKDVLSGRYEEIRDPNHRRILDRSTFKRKVVISVHAAYRFTQNDSQGRYCNQQLCMVLAVRPPSAPPGGQRLVAETAKGIAEQGPVITVALAPETVQVLPSGQECERLARDCIDGWKMENIRFVESHHLYLGSFVGYRWQLALTSAVTWSLHSVQGDGFASLATRIGRKKDYDHIYSF
uniref:Uncharacterized protein n=1 Tax=Chromera velia CCMP2878 TaxID=1169474 RepID=A0A0G4IDM0_9ALVE|eukprot:Cvel_13477.t1-p1 / transcript=Cvel_13477.t1 / gene=Cvel_13477 / organism=Chromera_velia_CCMP2878 / gene_product=hypothetical protein / transcript_product=hypothetical protein / location=Cvel_scaffold922:28233-30952(+) / protein_length=635 / sequence_SO=supercontig / SO=protein_coding / is_pseudo=false